MGRVNRAFKKERREDRKFNSKNKQNNREQRKKEFFENTEILEKNNDFVQEREDLIFGRNSVMEAISSGRGIEKILVSDTSEGSIKKLIAMARDKNILVDKVERKTIDRMTKSTNHQGVLAFVTEFKYSEVEDILEYAKNKEEDPFVIILDGVTDPHNLGAIMRTAECSGAHGIIIPKRRAVGVNYTVDKSSAGASAYVKVAKVTNIANTIKELKEQNVWVYACDMDGENLFETRFDGGVAIVLGNEGKGVSSIVRNESDFIISIPMKGKINSLNVSNAAAIAMYQVALSKFFK